LQVDPRDGIRGDEPGELVGARRPLGDDLGQLRARLAGQPDLDTGLTRRGIEDQSCAGRFRILEQVGVPVAELDQFVNGLAGRRAGVGWEPQVVELRLEPLQAGGDLVTEALGEPVEVDLDRRE
jgi:hypothetical protein